MYHPDRPDVIEGSDIHGLLKTELRRIKDRTFAILHVELSPHKQFADEGHLLHVTNGVNPRLLVPSGEDLDKMQKDAEAERRAAEKREEDERKAFEKKAEEERKAAEKAEEKKTEERKAEEKAHAEEKKGK